MQYKCYDTYIRSNMSRTVAVIAVSNAYTSKILCQDVSIRPLLDSNGNTDFNLSIRNPQVAAEDRSAVEKVAQRKHLNEGDHSLKVKKRS